MDDERTAARLATALVGFTVTQLVVDNAFALVLVRPLAAVREQQDARLTIESPFTLTLQSGVVRCEPDRDPRGLGPALMLLWRTVESARVDDDGRLELTFSGDASLSVASDPSYESWNLHTPEKALLVAMPGGEIVVFPPGSDKGSGG
jgi:Family of unknown function (DUF6188)